MTGGKDLVSTIAAACNNMPPLPDEPKVSGNEDIYDPEVDRAIDELVELYRTNPPESSAVVQFMDPPSSAQGKGAEVQQELEKGTDRSTPDGCPQCGEPAAKQARFCAMCGLPLQGSAAEGKHREERSDVTATKVDYPPYLQGRDHSSPYLLAVIFMLLAVISWRSGWDHGFHGSPSPQPMSEAPGRGSALPLLTVPAEKVERARKSRARAKRTAPAKQQPQADPGTDDEEVVWIRRTVLR